MKNALRLFTKYWICIPLLLFATVSDAASLSQGGATIAQTVTGMLTSLQSQKGVLLSSGRSLASILALLMVTWYGIMSMLESGEIHQVMGGLIRSLILYGLVIGFLTAYGSGSILDPVRFISGSMDAIKGMVAMTGGNTLGDGLATFVGAIVKVIDSDYITCDGWSDCITGIFTFLPVVLFKLIAVLCLVLGAVFYAGYSLLGEFMTHIGIILGPVMIPWLIFPPAAWAFNSWVKFMISAGMYVIVANIMANGANKMIDAISTMSGWSSNEEILYSSILMMIAALLLAFLMMQVSSIATGLLSGSANADVSGRMLGQVGGFASPVAGRVGGAAAGAAGAVKGGLRGSGGKSGLGGAVDGARSWGGGAKDAITKSRR